MPEPATHKTAVELLATLRTMGVLVSADGDKLRVSAPAGTISADLQAAIRAHKPTLLELLAAEADASSRGNGVRFVRLSPNQERLWLFQQLDPLTTTYNLTPVIHIDGLLVHARLEAAIKRVMERHVSLRSLVGDEHPGGVIHVAPVPDRILDVVDLSNLTSIDQIAASNAEANRQQHNPFDLTVDLPFRATLIKLNTERHALVTTFHHIAVDGMSLQHFYRDLATYYAGGTPEPLRASYPEFAVWKRGYWTAERLDDRSDFWRANLAGIPAILDLPVDFARGAVQGFTGDFATCHLGPAVYSGVKALAQAERASLFMVLLAAFGAALHRQSGQRDMVIGTPLHGRERSEFSDLIGMFINQLPLPVHVEAGATLRSLVRSARDSALRSMTEHEMPFGLIAEALEVPRDSSRNPLFQVMLNVLPSVDVTGGIRAGDVVLRLPDVHEMMALFDGQSRFDVTLYAIQRPTDLHLLLVYNRDLYTHDRMAQLLGSVERLLQHAQVADDPIDEILAVEPVALAPTRQSPSPDIAGRTVFDVVCDLATSQPDRPALEDDHALLTYAQLVDEAARVARLIHCASADRERPVGVMVPHDTNAGVALLGVLASGRPYVPLDPSYPAERLRYMAEDAGVGVVLTTRALADVASAHVPPGTIVLALEQEPARAEQPRPPAPGDLAYMLYTSGSTGRPKAVLQSHGNLAAQAERYAHILGVTSEDTLALTASISFDASLMDLFGGLLHGARVRFIDLRTTDLSLLPGIASNAGLTALHLTPTVFRTLTRTVQDADWSGIRAVVLGGESVRAEDVRSFDRSFPDDTILLNLYGSSENSFSIGHFVNRKQQGIEVPIGAPVGDVEVLLVDEAGLENPVTGEMVVRSANTASGYWNAEEAGLRAFIPDPAAPGRTLYRTGDLARRRPDGLLVALGRVDSQMKVRGYRIEPGEVETVLRLHPSIADAGIHAPLDDNGDAILTACCVIRSGVDFDTQALSDWCRQHIPAYMVPSLWLEMHELPRTPSGKVDRRALPSATTQTGAASRGQPPRTPAEEIIIQIWSTVLGRDDIGVFDDFFASGGHSLRAVEVVARMRDVFATEVPLRVLFEHPTVSGLAEWMLANAGRGSTLRPLIRTDGVEARLSFAQERVWLFQELAPDSTTYNVTPVMHLLGDLDVSRLERAVAEVLERHETLRTTIARNGDDVLQCVQPVPSTLLRFEDLSRESEADRDRALQGLVRSEHGRAFNLSRDLPVRVLLVRHSETKHDIVVTFHHLAIDWTSVRTFFHDVQARYEGRPLAPLPIRYRDYSVWERERWTDERLADEVAFWSEYLADAPPTLEFPTDRIRIGTPSYSGDLISIVVNRQDTERILDFARREAASPFVVLLAAFSAAIHRNTGQRDLVVGAPVSGRTFPELQGVMGMFINQLPLRVRVTGGRSFRAFLQDVRTSALGGLSRQDMPFPRLVESLGVDRDASRTPIFQVLLNVLPPNSLEESAEGASLRFTQPNLQEMRSLLDFESKFDFTLYALQQDGELHLALVYNADLFDAVRMRGLADDIVSVLHAGSAAPNNPLDDIWRIEPQQTEWAERLRAAGSRVEAASVPEQVARVAAAAPNDVAVIGPLADQSYASVHSEGLRIARVVREATIADPERPVGIVASHGTGAIAALLGTLMSGRPYVPLDASYPVERLTFMIADAGIRTILTTPDLRDRAAEMLGSEGVVITIDDLPADCSAEVPLPNPDSVAYLLYTSGSTGRPKAVVQTHRNLLQQAARYGDALSFGPSDRLAWMASISFDASLMDVFGGLTSGAAICPIDARATDFARLPALIGALHLTVLHMTPTVFRTMARTASGPAFGTVRAVVLGGEPVRIEEVAFFDAHFGPDALLFNLYGASEHSFSLGFPVDRSARGTEIPIGWPLGDVEVLLLDRDGQEDPVSGELVIRSRHSALRYWNASELSAKAFVPDPGVPGESLYRSGDVVRRRPDGAYVHLHRADQQMKVRGHRIEAYEVESALLAHPAVAEAAAHAPTSADGEATLIACVAFRSDQPRPSPKDLVAWCALRLPAYMVPSGWVTLDRLPRTPSGKIDRRALPTTADRTEGTDERVDAVNSEEVEVLQIWSDVLGLSDIGINDDFFVIGGHSLTATQVVSRVRDVFGVELPLRHFFDHPTVAGTAAWIHANSSATGTMPAPLRSSDPDASPLSFSQERLWFLHQLDPTSSAYNMATATLIDGPFDIARFRRAMDAVALRQESLRTRFALIGGRPVPTVSDRPVHDFTIEDVSGLPEAQRIEQSATLIGHRLGAPYDLETGPLCRVVVVRVNEERHAIGFGTHHTISDMWSYAVLGRDIRAAYEGDDTAPLPISYRDYAVWQRDWLKGSVLDEQVGYWKEQLANVAALELPTDFNRPPFMSFAGDLLTADLTQELREKIRDFSARNRITPFMTLLAGFNVLLSAYSGQEDIAVGVPIAGRRVTETQDLIGTFVNTIVHRNDVTGAPTFAELVQRVRATALDAYSHQDAPFELLVRELNVPRDPSRSPLMQVLFNVANVRIGGYMMEGLTHTPLPLGREAAQFDMSINVGLNEVQSEIHLTYNTSLFTRQTAERMLAHYLEILTAGVAAPGTPIATLAAPAAADRTRLLDDWNDTERPRAEGSSVPLLLTHAVETAPRKLAVESPTGSFTYVELLDYAQRVTAALQTMGVGSGDRVAIVMQRSREMLGALIGILGTGAAYVPVDPNYPAARVQYMLEDSGAKVVVAHRGLEQPYAPTVPVLDLDRWTQPPAAPFTPVENDQAAYVIYTSGSTGKPKGVEISHGAMVNFLLSMKDRPGITPDDVLLAVTTISFDIAVLELYLPLIAGARVIIAEENEALDGRRLSRMIEEHGVTLMQATPATWKLMIAAGWQGRAGMRVLCGGEPLPRKMADDLLDRVAELWNMYGPTETTVWSTLDLVARDEPILVGRPIANTTLYVLGENLELRPVGVPGELYIGGSGVANGYVNRQDLTAERFIASPFRPDDRLYRTGDLVRYRHDGRIEHLGRLDNQVKVRGFRIELGEVEAALQSHPAVRDAVVIANDDRLVGYVVLEEGGHTTGTELRTWVGGTLPPYMVPSFVLLIDALPLTPNGKVDRKQLPDPTGHHEDVAEWVAPEDPAGIIIAEVWASLLGVQRVGVGDNFFELGGHSLLAMEAVALIEERTGHRPEPRSLFFMTLGELAGTIPFPASSA